jgi:phage baseplate assembly protein W
MGLRSDFNVNEEVPRDLAVDSSGLFADLPLNFIPHPNTKDIRPVTDIQAIRQAVKILVLSNFSDRPFHPELGCNVTQYLFENADQFTALGIRDEVLRVIKEHEPRVSDPKVEIQLDADYNRLLATIIFQIRNTNINTEVSFYLDRIR